MEWARKLDVEKRNFQRVRQEEREKL